ncbi:hypothetical protein NR800_22710 [Corallococcus interemptor]|uniref:hypothetical protein n=1 Tax=Corallococcus TaxID=83461 RepID=UPI001CC14D26|nr:hypothetical protein [Corallococcus sp. AS-1-6]MBZ4374965.1 hypothetical protein [Corallococcus sp. AS-1-6]
MGGLFSLNGLGSGQFKAGSAALPLVPSAALRSGVAANHGVLTYTCVLPGSGQRVGIGRALNGDELAVGIHAADLASPSSRRLRRSVEQDTLPLGHLLSGPSVEALADA